MCPRRQQGMRRRSALPFHRALRRRHLYQRDRALHRSSAMRHRKEMRRWSLRYRVHRRWSVPGWISLPNGARRLRRQGEAVPANERLRQQRSSLRGWRMRPSLRGLGRVRRRIRRMRRQRLRSDDQCCARVRSSRHEHRVPRGRHLPPSPLLHDVRCRCGDLQRAIERARLQDSHRGRRELLGVRRQRHARPRLRSFGRPTLHRRQKLHRRLLQIAVHDSVVCAPAHSTRRPLAHPTLTVSSKVSSDQ